jgi:prephenate dehydratase
MLGTVAYQGEPGAFAEEACRRFLPDLERLPRPTFAAVVEAVRSGQAEFGMLPAENNSAGPVPGVAELVAATDIAVLKRVVLPVRMHLLALPGARLDEMASIASHPVALAQCAGMLKRLGAAPCEVANTALAARMLAETGDRSQAVLASEAAAAAYGLTILRRNVHDRPDNATTFAIIARGGARSRNGA